ncbi:hypothetical protein N473_17635 [Pseudoalteromonas luteoviolacea CPMOR-1]|uniref:Deoxyguanosinetriphosphate triphosphohydrolase-like protein n=1 Tax=Pseudoalteromonas luteoviolacea CPMOR-1 TaxID=1365248 RepID=A0A167KTQ6_9GAMM|nr:anti-phage deoxyguanosine triphosphatase [Pseudoalteromonas luteoviolacea]KZN63250.1 hypothetical protein N473_17635 [Pseudoalteromonas luteoviolacea CPMOR-1]
MSFEDSTWQERQYPQELRQEDHRSEYDRDEARLIHSSAFRRLQSKTQVLGLGESDFYRTRLTHSMEVAQIGRGIVKHLREKNVANADKLPPSELITAICLAHDIGHPPFGHGGEVALNYCMRDYGGFEGNGQTLRILGTLDKYLEGYGLNPTRRMLLGVLKYPAAYSSLLNDMAYEAKTKETPNWLFKAAKQKPPKCYHDDDEAIVEFILKPFSQEEREKFTASMEYKPKNDDHRSPETEHKLTKYKSLDCSIMNLADNISYSLHDFEDALSLELIRQSDWKRYFEEKVDGRQRKELFAKISTERPDCAYDKITKDLFESSYTRKDAIGSLVNLMISNTQIVENDSQCLEPLLRLNVELTRDVEKIRKAIFDLVKELVINNENVQQLEFKGQKLIIELFEVLATDPERFLPNKTKKVWEKAAKSVLDGLSEEEQERQSIKDSVKRKQMRVICDFVSGMTDEYATKYYEKLFTPSKGSIFDHL